MPLKRNLYKDNYGNIFYTKMFKGKKFTLPAHTKDMTIANKLHQTLEHTVLMEYYSPTNKKAFRSFRDLVTLYLKDPINQAKWSEATRATNKYVLRAFSLTREIPVNKETARTYQGRINACLNWAIQNGYKTDVDLMKVNSKVGRIRTYNQRELNLIFNEFSNESFSEFCKFAYYTGARRGELTGLKPHHIEPTRMKVVGKSGARFVKLNSQARAVLMNNELWQYKPDYITHTFKKEVRNLDIKDARFHDIRRTFGLNLIKEGMPIFKVSKLLGHSSVKITESH